MSRLCTDSWELINVIAELRSVVTSPMPLYVPVSPPPPPIGASNNGTAFQLSQASNNLDRRENEKGEIRVFLLLLVYFNPWYIHRT